MEPIRYFLAIMTIVKSRAMGLFKVYKVLGIFPKILRISLSKNFCFFRKVLIFLGLINFIMTIANQKDLQARVVKLAKSFITGKTSTVNKNHNFFVSNFEGFKTKLDRTRTVHR